MSIIPRVSSALKAVDIAQNPPPLIIGERLNTQGSKKAKELVLSNDFDGLLKLARTQVEDGAHCLDVCVATTERSDEMEFMTKLVKKLSIEIDAPLVIDSTDPLVVESALRQIPGKPIINSINLEGDGSRFHTLAPLMRRFGVPAIAMCIGPQGMAKTSEEKVKTAELLFNTGKKYNLKPWQYLFDVLTFTLATGESEFVNSANETLDGIRLVKKRFPNSFTTLGLSNVSFGLAHNARKVLNSVFLYHALQYGLDTVIVNARDVIPYASISSHEKKLAEDLIFNRNNNSLSEFISYFELSSNTDKDSRSTSRLEVDPSWDASQRCYFRIVNRLKDGIENDVVAAIADRCDKNEAVLEDKIDESGVSHRILHCSSKIAHESAVRTLNEVLLPAMKEVGDKFGAGEIILPFVLKSAECMKAAVAELEKYLIKQEGVTKGKLVLCTVYGDVHDIGKNLVKTIVTNNGYTVYDLGKQVALQTIVDKIKEVKPDAVGLSALLVSTSKQMQYFVEYARTNDIKLPILCGGAAINSNYINRIAKDGGIYDPGVFYCKTAFDGLKVMNSLASDRRESFLSDWKHKLSKWKDNISYTKKVEVFPHSKVVPIIPPKPPHINKIIRITQKDIDLYEVWKFLNKKSLFVLSWGIRGKAINKSESDPESLLTEWQNRVVKQKLFTCSVVYGYFKCHNNNNNNDNVLQVEIPNGAGEVSFDFPRSSSEKHLSITDYFGKDDIVAFQVVTVGKRASSVIEQWNQENRYTDAYYLHGLAVETAEALAEWVNHRIRMDLNIVPPRGLRYSWGYPSCPDVAQHHLVWKLLDPSKSDISLTEAGQIIPDQSTAAIVVHHPEAEYFVI
ncbi:MAG TPA: dihydropteroate synthase [Nitrososphaeraceae archaeon]|nr:dihydropteroate synthase [Nitrososphaeraceae archaeon]